jgi:SpoVK/Ycf46/Vps4 family AAA+-type ATPase
MASPPPRPPLVLTGAASRRLKLLISHGVELPPKLQDACSRLAAPADAAPDGAVVLAAALLARPAPANADEEGGAAAGARDLQAEVALAPAALAALGAAPGDLVEVRAVGCPAAGPRLARARAAAPGAPAGAAALAPGLALNLGLSLHLWPLLHPAADSAVGDDGALELALPASNERVCVARAPAGGAPPAEALSVALIREPVADLFGAGAEEGGEPAAGGGRASPAARARAAEEGVAAALERHLAGGRRLLRRGDVFAAPRTGFVAPAAAAACAPLPIDNGASATAAAAAPPAPLELLYFKVVEATPADAGTLCVDAASCAIRLVASCASGLPVGLAGYLSPAPPLPEALGVHAGAAGRARGRALPGVGALTPTWRRLAALAMPALHPAAPGGPPRTALLLHGPPGAGKRTAAAAAAAALGAHVVALSCRDLRAPGAPERAALDGLRAAFAAAAHYAPALLVLRDLEALAEGGAGGEGAAARAGAALAECVRAGLRPAGGGAGGSAAGAPVVLVGCAPAPDDVVPALRQCFTHDVEAAAPDEATRAALARSLFAGAGAASGAPVWADLARRTAGLLPRELRALAADACAAAALAALLPAALAGGGAAAASASAAAPPPPPGAPELAAALDRARLRSAEDLGAPRIPDVRWDDVGGLEDVKRAILDTVELPLRHPELFAGGLRRRSGVLLYGPPGTGKTLLAKAVATECAVNFLSVKGPELIDMYVGESERQVRAVFARARAARPCVVFFDELDSLAPARGRGSDAGGVMDRIVSQLLAEVDAAQAGGAGAGGGVFVVGATNRPDLLDPALLRPGRLDKLLYVGAAADAGAQARVLRALTRRFALAGDVDLDALAARCPPRLTGADLYGLCADAWMRAFRRSVADGGADGEGGGEDAGAAVVGGGAASALEDGDAAGADGGADGGGGSEVAVARDDFFDALADLRPSVTEEDVARYDAVRAEYGG